MRRFLSPGDFSSVVVLVIAWALAGERPGRAAGPYDEMLQNLAGNTNTLVLVDVTAAMSSPLARAEGWVEKRRQGGAGLGFIPADAERVVIGAEVNFNSLTRDFQIGLVKVALSPPSMQELAAREAGTVDEIAGRFAVLSPRDVYFTTLPGSLAVAFYPADRQYTARYLRAIQAKKTGDLSAYLRKAAAAAAADTVTIALDLEDVADRTLLRLSLPASPSVAKAQDPDLIPRLAQFLAGIKGMTFSARVDDGITGRLTVEFANDTGPFRRVLPDLVRELLEGQGVAIPGFENWPATFTNTTLTLSGPLTTADLRRLLSLFAFPNPAADPDPEQKGNTPTAAMTRRYLAAVDALLADLRTLRNTRNSDKTATWHEKAALQIEQLSRHRVDPIATRAAVDVARRLRAIADSLRGVPIAAQALQAQQYYSSRPQVGMVPGGIWGWRPFVFGPNVVETNIPQIQAEIARLVAEDEKRRIETWSAIDRILQEARSRLAEKYKTDF